MVDCVYSVYAAGCNVVKAIFTTAAPVEVTVAQPTTTLSVPTTTSALEESASRWWYLLCFMGVIAAVVVLAVGCCVWRRCRRGTHVAVTVHSVEVCRFKMRLYSVIVCESCCNGVMVLDINVEFGYR